jgi:hypothetical protein
MSDPIDALADTLLPVLFGIALAPRTGRLRHCWWGGRTLSGGW